MTVELIVLAAVLAGTVRARWSWVLMVVAVLLVLLLAPVRGLRLGSWLRSAVGYSSRGHLTQALPSGASTVGTYPVVSAFFPAASIRDGVDHGGQPVGILRWRESLNVSCRVSADVAEPLSERVPIALPLESLCASAFSSEIPVDSLQVFTQYRSADPLRTTARCSASWPTPSARAPLSPASVTVMSVSG